jgi:hypothetical protein
MLTVRLSTLLTLAACIMSLLPDATAIADGHNEQSPGVVLITGSFVKAARESNSWMSSMQKALPHSSRRWRASLLIF